jgi:2-oxoglutarate/2-oxoacid ferredoxin oxidoreductase subunit alpha
LGHPGTPGIEHRIGGLEKEDETGLVSYDGENHAKMVGLRAEKIARIAGDIPEAEVVGAEQGEVLVVGWGSSYGAIAAAVEQLPGGPSRRPSAPALSEPVAAKHGEVLAAFDRVSGRGRELRPVENDAARSFHGGPSLP